MADYKITQNSLITIIPLEYGANCMKFIKTIKNKKNEKLIDSLNFLDKAKTLIKFFSMCK